MTRSERTRFWNRHLMRQRHSGLSLRAYSAKHRLSLASLSYWSRKHRAGGEAALTAGVSPQLVPIELVAEPAVSSACAGASGVQVHAGRVRIALDVGFDAPTLRRTLEALGC